jgi:hypothetical protein
VLHPHPCDIHLLGRTVLAAVDEIRGTDPAGSTPTT